MANPFDYARDDDEHSQQVALMMWCAVARMHGAEAANDRASYQAPGWQGDSKMVAELDLLFAIPNGGQRDVRVAARLKAEGVKAGVADLCLPVARWNYHGLFIEMKKPSGGKVSEEQQKFGTKVQEQGYCWLVCQSWLEARDTLVGYLGL